MQLTDYEKKPIPMNGEHPAHDIFGTTIDYQDSYYIMEDEKIVHPINTDEYFVHVLKAELVRTGE